MLEILGLVAVGKWFHKTAKNNNLSPTLWVIVAIGSYIIGAIIAVALTVIYSPELIDMTLIPSLIGIVGGVIATLISYALFQNVIKAKNKEKDTFSSDLIDDNATIFSQKESDFK
jgi:hypothetical protein